MNDNEMDIVDGWGGDDDFGFDDDDDFSNADNDNGLNSGHLDQSSNSNQNNNEKQHQENDDIEEQNNDQTQFNNSIQQQQSYENQVIQAEKDGEDGAISISMSSSSHMQKQTSEFKTSKSMEGLISKLSSFVSSQDVSRAEDDDDDLLFDDEKDGWDWNEDVDDADVDDADVDDDLIDENNSGGDIEEGPSNLVASNSISQSNSHSSNFAEPVVEQKFIPYKNPQQLQQRQPKPNHDPQPQPQYQSSNNQTPAHEQQLLNYIQTIYNPSTTQTINHKIQQSTNKNKNHNNEKALELCQYYYKRPQLTEYTIDVEVPRMEYQIMISDELILVDQDEIQQYFKSNPLNNLVDDMLLRASNQSLLADIFPLVTGTCNSSTSRGGNVNKEEEEYSSSILVRNDFFATMIATKCRFVVDMRNERTTQGECNFILSIPWSDAQRYKSKIFPLQHYDDDKKQQQYHEQEKSQNNNNKLNLASIRFMVHFSPEPNSPFIKYHLVSIVPLLDLNNNQDLEKIHYASLSLEEMKIEHHFPHDYNGANITTTGIRPATDTIRDNFIQSIMSTQTGFKSALQDIDGVVNVSSKLNFLRNVADRALPILPSADDIMAAAAAAVDNDIDDDNDNVGDEQQQRQQPHKESHSLGHHNQQVNPPQPPLPPSSLHQPHQQQSKVGRPIIGGLLLSGISQLAEAVTAPSDVFNIDTYDNNFDNINDDSPLKLYRKDTPNDENKQVDHEQQGQSHHDNIIPKVWKTNASKLQSNVDYEQSKHFPNDTNMKKESDVKDDGHDDEYGWDDDDLDLDVNDEEVEEIKTHTVENKYDIKVADIEQPLQKNHEYNSSEANFGRRQTRDNAVLQNLLPGASQDGEQKQSNLSTRQKDMIAKMKEIRQLQIDINDPLPQGFVYDESTGIIPTRKRFIPRSEFFADLIKGVQ